jgi:CBS-domain-containing membrane protein
MLDHSIGALPVMEGGRLAGIVTEADILRGFVWLSGGSARRDSPGGSELSRGRRSAL